MLSCHRDGWARGWEGQVKLAVHTQGSRSFTFSKFISFKANLFYFFFLIFLGPLNCSGLLAFFFVIIIFFFK